MSESVNEGGAADVRVIQVEDHAELHLQYRGQTSPQDVFVELDCEERTLHAQANGEIGNAVPARVWHRRALRWGIPALTADAANDLLERIAPIAAEVCEGYESHWNGSNHVGRYSADAEAAIEAIEALCEAAGGEGEELTAWDAEEWIGGIGSRRAQRASLGITAGTTEAELDAIVERLEEEAERDGVVVEGLRRYLHGLQAEALDLAEGRG